MMRHVALAFLAFGCLAGGGTVAAQIQDWRNPFYRAGPPDDRPVGGGVETGRLSRLVGTQKAEAESLIAPVRQAVASRLGAAEVRLSALSVGELNGRRILCGTAEPPGGAPVRFIARPGVATLETEAPAASFERSLQHIGCA
jgi:hypothetical protein